MAAFKLPQGNAEETAQRESSIQSATKGAAEVPLQVAERAAQLNGRLLQLEAIAQVAGILLLKNINQANQIAYFMAAEEVKWRKPVVPGDTLLIEVELTKVRGKIGKAKGVCKVDGDVVSEAEVTFMMREI